jgi:hypothetical protein
MAPSFDRLGEEDFQDDDEEIDFSGAPAATLEDPLILTIQQICKNNMKYD